MSSLELTTRSLQGRTYRGLGEASSETPEIRELPWQIDKGPSKSERRWSTLEKVGTVAGVIGGIFGVVLAIRSFRSGED